MRLAQLHSITFSLWAVAAYALPGGVCADLSVGAVYIQGERNLKLSFHASAAMPTHNDTYLTCPTRVSALKAGKRHIFCGRNALFLLLPLEDGRAAGVRGRRFTSKAGQRAAHLAASLEM